MSNLVRKSIGVEKILYDVYCPFRDIILVEKDAHLYPLCPVRDKIYDIYVRHVRITRCGIFGIWFYP